MCIVPPNIVRIARKIRVMGMATAAWFSACVSPEIAVYSVDSQGRNSAANSIMPAVMATLPCTRMSSNCSLSVLTI